MLFRVLAGVALALAVTPLQGSGSYVTRPPLPASHDSNRYELGKAIATGRLPLPAPGKADTAAHAKKLAALQEQLPARVRRTVALPALAGRLTADQFGALEYYLRVRYKIR
ncbi:MAG: hypothetical protein U0Q16_35225 [Bryobacteraceae bacterium]